MRTWRGGAAAVFLLVTGCGDVESTPLIVGDSSHVVRDGPTGDVGVAWGGVSGVCRLDRARYAPAPDGAHRERRFGAGHVSGRPGRPYQRNDARAPRPDQVRVRPNRRTARGAGHRRTTHAGHVPDPQGDDAAPASEGVRARAADHRLHRAGLGRALARRHRQRLAADTDGRQGRADGAHRDRRRLRQESRGRRHRRPARLHRGHLGQRLRQAHRSRGTNELLRRRLGGCDGDRVAHRRGHGRRQRGVRDRGRPHRRDRRRRERYRGLRHRRRARKEGARVDPPRRAGTLQARGRRVLWKRAGSGIELSDVVREDRRGARFDVDGHPLDAGDAVVLGPGRSWRGARRDRC